MNTTMISGAHGAVVVNGKSYLGNNVTVINGVVTVDGVRQDGTITEQQVQIVVQGDAQEIHTGSGNVSAHGAAVISTQSGDVTVKGQVHGNVSTMSGDVTCGNIAGSVRTMSGDINRRG